MLSTPSQVLKKERKDASVGAKSMKLTWLASMYNRRLKAAPAQAVSKRTPVELIIFDNRGKIRNIRGRY